MDVYDTALTSGAGRDESGTEQAAAQAQRPPQPSGEHAQEGASSSSSQEAPKTENLQDEVQQLVGSMSSWWKGVSKQSQAAIASSRAHVQAQGGILGFAKNEMARFEAQLSEAQKKAREESKGPTQGTSAKGKGKATESAVESGTADQDGNNVNEAIGSGAANDATQAAQKGAETADKPSAGVTTSSDSPLSPRDGTAPSAQSFVSRLSSQLASNPSIASLQRTLALALSPESSNTDQAAGQRSAATGGSNVSESLHKLTLAVQGHLPQLDWAQSQQLAGRYLHASENFVQDLGKEMRDLVGDMVKIVPPEQDAAERAAESARKEGLSQAAGEETVPSEKEGGGVGVAVPVKEAEETARGSTDASPAVALAKRELDPSSPRRSGDGTPAARPEAPGLGAPATKQPEEEFDWDAEEDVDAPSGSARPVSEPAAKPSTTSSEAAAEKAPESAAPQSAPSALDTKSADTVVAKKEAKEDSGEDSDWE